MAFCPLSIDPSPVPRHTPTMKETVPTLQQKVAPIWVKTEVTPSVPGYEVLKLLGQGGMGQVYQARHLQLQRIVALKLVTSTNNDQALARFEQEVQAIARLRHPNIAQIYENGTVEGRPYYAMEYVAGGTLSDRLKASPLLPNEAAKLVVKLARAMQHAHEQGILHRDLKPSNVLLEADGLEPKIADFGLAKKLDDNSNLTRTGDVFGSPSYMAPEQASGVMKFTPAVDVYALGATLYECLTGRPPFLGPEPMLTIMMVLSNDPIPPRQVQAKLPLDLDTICLKCLEKQPRKRYASAAELADDLERFLKGEPILARPVGGLERALKWAKRRPWQAGAVGLAMALLAGLIVGLLLLEKAYSEVKRSSEISIKSFELSKKTLDEVLGKITSELSLKPDMEKLTLDSVRPAVELFRELHLLRPEDRATSLEYLAKLESFTVQLVLSHSMEEAQRSLAETASLIQKQRQTQPDDVEWQLAELRRLINTGWMHRQQDKRELAIPFEKQALVLLNQLKKDNPSNLKLLRHSNDLLRSGIADDITFSQSAANREERGGYIQSALDKYRQIIANSERSFQLERTTQNAADLISSRKSLATVLIALRQFDEADELYRSIEASIPLLVLPEREKLAMMVKIYQDQSAVAGERKDFAKSYKLLQQAEQVNQQLRQLFPTDAGYLYDACFIQSHVAALLYQQEQQQEAINSLISCLKAIDAGIEQHPQYQPLKSLRTNVSTTLSQYQQGHKSKQGS